ncbi:aminodeoxychorismate lyase [Lysinibacillus macroides]|uniref:4-amino-4-deoxychorismate lyase n=1 Tax=Lysinibacillus macroides TaxID=33935 RepID=A0A0N1J004_9BACI|nr:aminodeoxychorismate lyase [Lysinibacillus macroides]KOY79907.1 4-amino-4-deoxychorismate lyase [Lysinibacillus macroides]QPR67158.1 aminodeoxychorismate lyase [Lysinibacillus macroides]
MQCWMNGQYIDEQDLRISPFDHGFLYGLGFFETFRTYGGQVFGWEAHIERLQLALSQYRIHLTYNEHELLDVVQQLNKLVDGQDGYFRLNVSAGEHAIGLQPTEYRQPNVIIFRKQLQHTARGTEKTAQWLTTRRNTPEQEVRLKSHHYGNNVLGRFEMPSLAQQEGFFLTQEGYVAEGVTSNIFWVKNDILYTPSLETGILPGIIRAWAIQKARVLGMDVREGLFTQQDVKQSTECFITNSIQELVPISNLEDHSLLGNKGPVYSCLHEAFVKEVECLHA